MKSALIAALVAAVIAAGGASAGTRWIDGRAIRPGTIRLSRLEPGAIAKLQGQQGPQGIPGPEGPAGPQGPAGATPRFQVRYLCIAADNSVTFGGIDRSGCASDTEPLPVMYPCFAGEPVDACLGFKF